MGVVTYRLTTRRVAKIRNRTRIRPALRPVLRRLYTPLFLVLATTLLIAWDATTALAQQDSSGAVNQSRLPPDWEPGDSFEDADDETDSDEDRNPEEETELVDTKQDPPAGDQPGAEPSQTNAKANGTGDDASSDQPPPKLENPGAYCNRFMEPYVRSSARKLYRALSGHDFELQELNLQNWIDVKVRTPSGEEKTVEFEVHREKDRKVAGLVDTDRSYRRTLIVAMTDSGPLIASQKWPKKSEIENRAACQPLTSRVEYPVVPLDEIDIEPFKFWGMRVLWRLPTSYKKGRQNRENLYKTIVDVMSSERAGDDQ